MAQHDLDAAYEALAKKYGGCVAPNDYGCRAISFTRAISAVEARALTADIKALEAKFTDEAGQEPSAG